MMEINFAEEGLDFFEDLIDYDQPNHLLEKY